MSGVVPRFQHGGPVTYQVAEAVAGGKLVEARAGGLVGVAAAASVHVLGIATKDAQPTASGASTDSFGNPVQSLVEVTNTVAVDGNGKIYPVTYAAAAAFGDVLIAAANGQVTPAGAAPDARQIVGRCVEPNGVAAGAVGLARITV